MQKVVEYVWIDGFGSVRSKTRVASSEVDTVDRVSCWNYDGSSTRQALLNNSEIILRPVKVVKDPFRRPNGLIALCQTEVGDGQPARLNFRMACEKVAKMAEKHKVWFGLEQEYYFLEKSGVVVDYIPGSSANKGMYYCGVGHHSKRLRKVTDLHLEYCIYAGVQLSGLNAEVSVGQWEFQVGTCVGIEAADDLILARYILIRLAEDFQLNVSFHPKLLKGTELSGSGCHINLSSEESRGEGGLKWIEEVAVPALRESHKDHLKVYGADNQHRLTGTNETAHYKSFSHGIGDRGASIRIPSLTKLEGRGYFEDRRPGANIDPYLATGILMDTLFCGGAFRPELLSLWQQWSNEPQLHC